MQDKKMSSCGDYDYIHDITPGWVRSFQAKETQ